VDAKKSRDDPGMGHWIRKALEKHPAFLANPVGDWNEIVGEQVARYTQPVSLKDKVLTVAAYDSVWKYHLEVLKESILAKINRKRPIPLVEKILVRVGEVPEPQSVLNRNHRLLSQVKGKRSRAGTAKKSPLRPLTPDEKEFLKRLPDNDLRKIGARLLRKTPLETE